MNDISYHRGNTSHRALGLLALLPLATALVACSSDQVSLGDRAAPLDGPAAAPCHGGVVSGSVNATTQVQIDALAGCEEIVGDLRIFGELDLQPLGSLRIVRGNLNVTPNDQVYPGGAASLDGLESLEQVSGLTLYELGDTDLSPLAGLTRVLQDPLSPWPDGGYIDIQGCDHLVDLTGLGGLREWQTLMLQDNASLSSLRGIGIPTGEPALIGMALPALSDLSALAPLRRMQAIRLWNTGLESLDGLELEILRGLYLLDNAALVDLDALNSLQSITSLTLYQNAALQQLPRLPDLQRILRDVQIVGNPELRSVPHYAAGPADPSWGLGGFSNSAENPDTVLHIFTMFEVGNNPKLTHLSVPSGFRRGQYVGIYDNPSLTELDMSAVEKLDMLSLRNNTALPAVAIDALETVDDLIVTGNTALPATTFDDVATFTRDMSGNAPGDAP